MLVMLSGVQVVAMSDLRMVRCLFVIPGLVVLCGLAMVFRCMLVMFSSLLMVFVNFVIGHFFLPVTSPSVAGVDETFATLARAHDAAPVGKHPKRKKFRLKRRLTQRRSSPQPYSPQQCPSAGSLRQLSEVGRHLPRLTPSEEIGGRVLVARLTLIVEIAELLSVLVADDEADAVHLVY
jgi:hypothetical protein